jgi:hypothetical protein
MGFPDFRDRCIPAGVRLVVEYVQFSFLRRGAAGVDCARGTFLVIIIGQTEALHEVTENGSPR